jgi:hypothetical protein
MVLDSKKVKAAEKEEIDFMEKLGVGELSSVVECWRNTGRPPTTTKFVRVNKGADGIDDIRARLCARDFKAMGAKTSVDLFASMPPLEAKKMLFRQAIKEKDVWKKGAWRSKKLLFIDVKKAHLNGIVPDEVYAYVELPDGKIWRLKRWLYGMRPAANAWESDFTKRLIGEGFARGKASPTVFFRKSTGCRCVVHGDDFTFLADDWEVKQLVKRMQEWYEIKVRGILGGKVGDDEDIVILNRRLKWAIGENKIEYEADPKHVKEVLRIMNLESGSKGRDTPCEREEVEKGEIEDESTLLVPSEATKYRGVSALLNYLGQDRPDIQYGAKEICRSMSAPRESGWKRVKIMARPLAENPRLVWTFDGEHAGKDILEVSTDSDWAGDKRTRKSTSGGVASFSGQAVKSWSSTQGTIATSSGEAEYYALVKGAAEGLAIQALGRDLGIEMDLKLWVDSTAADSIVSRIGLGRVRHMEVKYLWAQEAHQNGRFKVGKVAGERNPADVLTKPKSVADMNNKLSTVGAEIIKRRVWDKMRVKAGGHWADEDAEEASD